MYRVRAQGSAQLTTLAALALVGVALSGCSDRQDEPLAPSSPTPRSQVLAGSGTWVTRAPLPTARGNLSGATLNGIVYAVGGEVSSHQPVATVEAYDPATNTWSTKQPMLTARYYHGTAALNGILYAVSGTDSPGGQSQLASVEAYDPTSDTWTTKQPIGTPRFGLSLAALNGKLYAVGGIIANVGPQATVEEYDPVADTWAPKAPMHTPRGYLGLVAINGLLYAVGGQNNSGFVAAVEVYDPATDTWTITLSMPTARSTLFVGGINGVLYAVGGGDASGYLATNEAYNSATDTWATDAPLSTGRVGGVSAVANGVLYAIGGGDGSGSHPTNEAFTPAPTAADQTIAFSALGDKTFGDAPFAISASASSGLAVSFTASGNCTVTGSTVSLTGAGACIITADQAGDASFNPAPSVAQSFSIAMAAPVISWNLPPSMVYGAALSSTQLNATASGVGGVSLSGGFAYSPPAGTVLNPGTQTLSVSFTPDDPANYTSATKSVSIAVLYNPQAGHRFLQPINLPPQAQSVFKIGSTIPVKFQLFQADGVTPVSTAVATIQVNKVSSGVPSPVNESVVSTVPNAGISFRYDPTSQQYIFNLSTKSWTSGSYLISGLLDDGSQITVVVGAR